MKKGDKITCPHCGEKSFVREKRAFNDDLTRGEAQFFCALCGKELVPEKNTSTTSTTAGNKGGIDRLSQLLGGEKIHKVTLEPTDGDGMFCLHCAHFLTNPFVCRCGLTFKEIEATDSCSDFEPKK